MDPQPLFTYLERYHPLADEEKELLASHLSWHEYAKHDIILREGSVCRHLYYIEAGLTRCYHYRDGRDITTWFGSAGALFTVIDSLLGHTASRFTLCALEPTQVCAVPYAEVLRLYARSHALERIGRLITLDGFVQMGERINELQFHSAHDRYERFCAQFPELAMRVPLTHIASYLGITLETLSRVRAGSRTSSPNLINVK